MWKKLHLWKTEITFLVKTERKPLPSDVRGYPLLNVTLGKSSKKKKKTHQFTNIYHLLLRYGNKGKTQSNTEHPASTFIISAYLIYRLDFPQPDYCCDPLQHKNWRRPWTISCDNAVTFLWQICLSINMSMLAFTYMKYSSVIFMLT